MKIDDSIKFVEFVLGNVYWEGTLDEVKAKEQFREVLRQLKLRRADITKLEIVEIEKQLREKKELLKEVSIEDRC